MLDLPPDVPPQYTPIVVAEAAQAKNQTKERTIGVCQLVSSLPDDRLSAVNSLSVARAASNYLKNIEHKAIDDLAWTAAKMTLLEAPKHGELELHQPTQSAGYFSNVPNFEGTDQATVLVEIGGYKVTVKYFIKVMLGVGGGSEQGTPYDDKKNCPNGRVWKISHNLEELSTYNVSHNKPLEPTR